MDCLALYKNSLPTPALVVFYASGSQFPVVRKTEEGESSSESPGQAFQKGLTSICPLVPHGRSLLRVTVFNFYDSNRLVPLTDIDCLFSLF